MDPYLPPVTQGMGICITSLASGFMKEISVSLLGDPEMCSLQLGEDLEDA